MPHPAFFASTVLIHQIRFCLPPPLPNRFLLRLYARIFSSLQISAIPSCILSQLTPPPPSPDDPTPFFGVAYTPPLCTYIKNSYASCIFFTSTTLPLLEFFFTPPLAYPTLQCFASTAPIPQIRFCLPPPRFLLRLYIYPDLFFFTNVRHTLLHFISTYPPNLLSSLPLSGIPSYSLRQLPPPPPFIFATFRTPDFSQLPLQFSLLYPR